MLQSSMTTVTLDCENKDIYDIIDWCEREIGVDRWSFNSQFPNYHWQFHFPTAEQATFFRLKWQ